MNFSREKKIVAYDDYYRDAIFQNFFLPAKMNFLENPGGDAIS